MKKSLLLILLMALLAPWATYAQTSLFSEDFEDGSMPADWTTDGPGTWSVGTGDYSSSTGAGQGTYNALIKHNTTGNVTKLITPEIDLSSVSSAELSFMHIQRSWAGDFDFLKVYYRASSSDSWTLIQGQEYTSAVATWTTEDGIALPNLSSTYQIAFEFTDKYGYGVGVDNIVIVPGASCPKPSGLEATLTPGDGSVATLSWTAGGTETNWVLEYGTAPNFSDAQSENISGTPSANLTGLTPETVYFARVKADCGGGDESEWSSPISFLPTATVPVVVNEGTTTNSYIPFYGYYVNNTPNQSQFIIPAASLDNINPGSAIKKITFHGSSTSANNFGSAKFIVHMKEVAGTTFESATFVEDKLEEVYNGTVSYDNKEMEIVLDNDFIYSGGNLLIGFSIDDPAASSGSSVSWYGVSGSGNNSIYKYMGYSSVTGPTRSSFMPKVTFRVIQAVLACDKPKNLAASEIDHEKATITWTSDESAWNIAWSTNPDFDPATASDHEDNVSTKSHTITGLNALTDYYVSVQSACDGDWSNILHFKTTAEATIVGDSWSDDFEGTTCGWELINGELTNANWAWGTATSNGGTHSLYVSKDGGATYEYNNSGYAKVFAAKLLNFTAGKYQFSYDWQCNGESSFDFLRVALVPGSQILAAGTDYSTIGSSSLPSGWIALDGGSKLNTVTSWQSESHTVNVVAGNYYLVLAWRQDNSGGTQPPAAVDNVNIVKLACPYDVAGLAVDGTSITTSSATLTWTAGEATQWQIAHSKDNSFPDGQTTMAIVSEASASLSGLDASSTYFVKVRAYCGGEDFGTWSNAISFATECDAITNFPWSENFESYPAGNFTAPCWVNEHISGDGSYIFKITTSTNGTNTTHQLQLPDQGSGTLTKLMLPEMNLPTANYQFVLDVYRSNSTYSPEDNPYEGIRVFVSTNGQIEGATELAFIPRQYDEANGNIPAESAAGWYSYELPLGVSGNCNIILRGENRYCSSTFMDNFIVEQIPTCKRPSALMLETPSSRTAHAASLKWTKGEESQSAWEIAYSKLANFNPDEQITDSIASADSNPFTLSGLEQSTTYYAYVRANCGIEDGKSAWSSNKASFTTLSGHQVLSSLALVDGSLGSQGAEVNWKPNAYNELHASYEIYYSQLSTLPATEEALSSDSLIQNISDTFYVFSNLDPETQYYVWVRDNCATDGLSAWSSRASFTTLANCAVPFNLAASEVSAHEATIAWEGNNDSYSVQYRTASIPGTIILNEGFEGGSMPSGWGATSTYWNVGSGTGYSYYTGAATGNYNATCYINKGSSTSDILVTPAMDLSTASAAKLSFNYRNVAWGSDIDELHVYYRVNEGDWQPLYENLAAQSAWTTTPITIELTGLAANYQIGFKCTTGSGSYNYGYGMGIDDVLVYEIEDAGQWQSVSSNVKSKQISGLAPETKYDVQVLGVCGSITTEPSEIISFTTLPSCLKPTELMAALTVGDGTVATLNWAKGGSESAWILEYGTASDFTGAISVNVSGATSKDLTDLTPETTYYARVKADCGGGDESEWSDAVSFEPTSKIQIGSGNGTNNNLPVDNFYKNSLTQQIYTVAELGTAGAIVSIDFYKNNVQICKRDLNIYMVSTNKNSFADATDWISVSENDLVFSGEISFADNAWTTIELQHAFNYDGVKNVAIIIDDNTGSYNSYTSFLVFDANNQALAVQSDGTDYNPFSPSSDNGTLQSSKNQIRVLKGDFYALKVGASGYATYYDQNQAYTMPADLSGHAFSTRNAPEKLVEVYTEGNVVPANMP